MNIGRSCILPLQLCINSPKGVLYLFSFANEYSLYDIKTEILWRWNVFMFNRIIYCVETSSSLS